ncbi:unnamed protein product [Acanthoscelides obtectus]|uniref:Uncharacterized protein n=1 Tax=Acanthoscelides obtectus TaxID=200917 RepID=A0A9P0M946_ACAOB|nr:unnamed protein product [Acanthoscelides obtectus]CAK1623088.1 hypothetical protein AOBTE_LOCUS1808 [Acanthoscelides obtectus]
MHKKYTKQELAEYDERTEKKSKKKRKEHRKEKNDNQVLFLKYDPRKIFSAKVESKREKSSKDREPMEHAIKKKSGETNSDNVQDTRISKNTDEREKLYNETTQAYETYRKYIRKLEKDNKISSSSLNIPKQKKALRLRKENTIHLATPSHDMPIFKPFTAVKIDEKKHKSKKKKGIDAPDEKKTRGEGDQKHQVLYCQIETDAPFKHGERQTSEARVAFTEHHKRHSSKRKSSSQRIKSQKSHREKSSAKHRKPLALDEYIFEPQDKPDKNNVTELFGSRDEMPERRKHKSHKSHSNAKSRKHSSTNKDKSSKGTEEIKSYFEKIQSAIDKKIDSLLGPRQKHPSNALSLEKEEKPLSKSKVRHRSPHKKHHSSSRGARELSRKKSIVQSMSDSRVHLKSSDVLENIDKEAIRSYITNHLSKKEKNQSQELNKSSDSKKSSKRKSLEFKVEGVEPPNLQSKNPQKKHVNRNLECKTVSIIGIPSSIQDKSIMLNNTQTNTSLKFSNSVEDIVEKKKKTKRFKLYYKYSMDSSAITNNSLNSEEHSVVSGSYRLLTDQSDHEIATTEPKCDVIPVKLTFQKTQPKKSQDTLNKCHQHKHQRKENLIKLNDIIEEKHDTPPEQLKRPWLNQDVRYEFFRALHSSNSEYGLNTLENKNTDIFEDLSLSKNWPSQKQSEIKFYVNKPKKTQMYSWKYMSKSDVNVSYVSLCDKSTKKKPKLEQRPRNKLKEGSKEKRSLLHHKEKANIAIGDQPTHKRQPSDRSTMKENDTDISMKEYLKKIYDISMEIKKKFFENGESVSSYCKDSQMFDLLCLTDPRNLFATIESTSRTSNVRRERIQLLQNLSSNMNRVLQESNKERDKNFDSHTHREKFSQIQTVSTNKIRSIVSPDVKSPESDAQNVCLGFPIDTSRLQVQLRDSRDLSSNVAISDNISSKIPHSKPGSCMSGKNIKTQTLKISEVGVSTKAEKSVNQDVQTSKGNIMTTIDAAIETYDISVDKDQPNSEYNKYIKKIISTVGSKGIDAEMLKKFIAKTVRNEKRSSKDKSKLQKVGSNQRCKSVFYRYKRRMNNLNVISSPRPIEQVGREENEMKEQIKGSSRSSGQKKWCPVETVYVPRKDSEPIQEDDTLLRACKQYISKEIISVNVPVKSSSTVVDKQSKGSESEQFMAQRMIEMRPLEDGSSISLKKRYRSTSSIEVIVNDDNSSKMASLICLQKFTNDGGYTMSSRDTSQLSDRTEPRPQHNTMMLTKQYKTSDVSSYQRRKMYDNMIRKKMKKTQNHNNHYEPQVFEVRFMSLDRQSNGLEFFPNKKEKMHSKVINTINRVSQIKQGIIRSGIESVFVSKYKIYEFCQHLTRGHSTLFNETYFGCKSCSYDWSLDDNIDSLVDFLRKSISLFYKCGCKAENVDCLGKKDKLIYKPDVFTEEETIAREELDGHDEEDRETISSIQIEDGLVSRYSDESGYTSIQSEQSADSLFKTPNIAVLMYPTNELQRKRSKLFRSNTTSETEMMNYDRMARQCQVRGARGPWNIAMM